MEKNSQEDKNAFETQTPPPQQYQQQYQQSYQSPSHGVAKEPFYRKTWFVVLCMIVFPPAGIVLAWVFKKPRETSVRVLLTVFSALILIVAIFPKGGSTSEDHANSTQNGDTYAEQKTPPADEVKKEVDKSELKTSIDGSLALDPSGYTPESYSPLSSAITDAQTVYNDPDATESEVEKAISALATATSSLKEAFNPANYAPVEYTDLARNPDNYAGSDIVITGKVLQVSEGSSEIDLRVATDMGYDDVVFVGYDPSLMDSRVLEDDIVTVYGMCIGLYSYTSTLGATISVPGVYADQIEIQ